MGKDFVLFWWGNRAGGGRKRSNAFKCDCAAFDLDLGRESVQNARLSLGPLAQLAEQLTLNQRAVGSNPTRPTSSNFRIFLDGFTAFRGGFFVPDDKTRC